MTTAHTPALIKLRTNMTAQEIEKFQLRRDAKLDGSEHVKTLLELLFGLTKMSDIIDVMVYGLETQSRRDDFVIDMHTFGSVYIAYPGMCFGCAATCALSTLTAIPFTEDKCTSEDWLTEIGRTYNCAFLTRALVEIESFFDNLRRGYDVSDAWRIPAQNSVYRVGMLPKLDTDSWREDLHHYVDAAKQLREAGY